MISKKQKSPLYGIWLMTFGFLLFSTDWIAVKMVSGSIPLFEIIFFRSLFGGVLLASIMIGQRTSLVGKNHRLLFLRAIIGFVGLVMVFYAIGRINIGNVATLMNTAPFFVVILAPFMLGEKFNRKILIWLLIGFIGVVLILKPSSDILQNVSLLPLLAGLIGSFVFIIIKKLQRTDSPFTIAFYFMWIPTLASIPFLINNFVWPTPVQFILLLYIGMTIAIAQVIIAHSFKFAEATTLAPFTYSFVIFTYLGGIVFLSEVPDLLSVIGAVIIILSGGVVSYIEGKKKIHPTPHGMQT